MGKSLSREKNYEGKNIGMRRKLLLQPRTCWSLRRNGFMP